MRITLACAAAALLLAPVTARGHELAEGFTGAAIDAGRWTVTTGGGNTVALDQAHHRVVMTQAGQDGAGGLTYDEVAIEGDFDVRVSYAILTPRPPDHNNGNQERIGLCIAGVGCVERVSDGYFGSMSAQGGGEVYLAHFGGVGAEPAPWPGVITTDLAGALRYTRVGSTGTAYYWDGTAWAALTSATVPTGPVDGIGLSIFNGYHPQDGMQIAFDDFVLSAPATAAPKAGGGGGCASAGGAGVAGLAGLLLAAAGARRPRGR